MEYISEIEEVRMMKREMISKLQDLLDEYEDNAWNRREHQIISLRRKIEELLEGEIGDEKEMELSTNS